MTILETSLAGWAGLFVLFTGLWLVQRRTNDAGVVDVGWAAGLGLLAALHAVVGAGPWERRLLVGAMATLWSLRLALHLLFDRIVGKPEDGRYQALRAAWGERQQPYLFLFFQAQALLDVVLAVPFAVAMSGAAPFPGPGDALGLVVLVVAVLGESLSDRQLARFRGRPESKGKTCREGLWRYSRHPNYFFEWLHWWSYVAVAALAGAAWWWASLLGPALILLFLLRVTGIPYTEAQALKSRGDDYRDYQRTTSAFVPWFPKRSTP